MLNIWIEAVARGGGVELQPGTVVLTPRKSTPGIARRGAVLLGGLLIDAGRWLLARAQVEEARQSPSGCVPA